MFLVIVRAIPLSLCKSVPTLGGAISTILNLVSFSCVRRFMVQKCTHAFVPPYNGLMILQGQKPSTELTLMMRAPFGFDLKWSRKPIVRCIGPRILMLITSSALSSSNACIFSGRCTPALLTRQSTSGCSAYRIPYPSPLSPLVDVDSIIINIHHILTLWVVPNPMFLLLGLPGEVIPRKFDNENEQNMGLQP